jgi:hypothetical protein
LREEVFELDFAPCSAGGDVREDALEVADSGRERLHFAEAFVDLLETVADELEGFAEAALERALEFLVHGVLHGDQVLGDGGAERFGALVGLSGEAVEFFAESAVFFGVVEAEVFDAVAQTAFGGAGEEEVDGGEDQETE